MRKGIWNWKWVIGLWALGGLVCCKDRKPEISSDSSNTEAKDRAEVAAAKVTPALEAALAAKGLLLGDPVFIRAIKEERVLELFVRSRTRGKFELFRRYPIAAASGELGPKLLEGDRQVPEGFYFVPPAGMKPDSQFHLAFNIGYPNAYDRAHGRTGSAIMVHGDQRSIGCLAMTDAKIEEIYTLCAAAHRGGQPFFRIHIFPFRMTDERQSAMLGDSNCEFWKNLAEGYVWFEKTGVPPEVSVVDGRYVFKP
jgi:murein L,D-transpeptidase YafK